MNKETLSKLRKKLPSKYIKILKNRVEYSESAIYKALHGNFENNEIIEAAITLAKEYQQQKKEMENQISEL